MEKLERAIEQLPKLLEQKTDIKEYIKDLADMIREHVGAELCSLYAFDKPEGKLKLGAQSTIPSLDESSANSNLANNFSERAFSGLVSLRGSMAAEDSEIGMSSYLIVPVRSGPEHIGVVALYHRSVDYFTNEDEIDIRTIVSRIAVSIENAMLLKVSDEIPKFTEKEGDTRPRELTVRGMAISPGVATGEALLVEAESTRIAAASATGDPSVSPIERFESALQKSYEQLELLQNESESRLSVVASLIFGAHFLMLRDESFTGEMRGLIKEGTSPDDAIVEVVEKFTELFLAMNETRQREKAQDVRDLGYRLLRNMASEDDEDIDYRGQIAIVENVFPSEIVKLAVQKIEGVLLLGQGVTAHISILSQSLGLPVLIASQKDAKALSQGTPLLLDGDEGLLYLHPTKQRKEQYENQASTIVVETKGVPQTQPDEIPLKALATINLYKDVTVALEQGADGIGLYRTEFPFILRRDILTEDEQFLIYSRIIKPFSGRELVLRTADIGGDKLLDPASDLENNPFLGVRGIRFSLANREIFRDQLRALLRAGEGEDLRIMFPMVSTLEEIEQAKEELENCLADLSARGIPHNPSPKIGAMIELPSAVEAIDDFCSMVDFLSIGTNDLVMYLLGVDRTNERLSELYRSYHPSVLRTLRRIADGVGNSLDELSVCGEAASDPNMIPFFLGIGIKKLSVIPKLIPKVRRMAAAYTTEGSAKISREMLEIRSIRDMTVYMESLGGEGG